MKDEINTELLTELARLTRRYPPEAWESLLHWLEDETRRKQVVTLLRDLAQLSAGRPSISKKQEKLPSIAHLFGEIQPTDERKADLLRVFWEKLVAREVLPSLGSVRSFAEMVGLKVPTSNKREQAIRDVVRQLANLSYADIEAALEKTAVTSRDFGQEYQRWVNIILRGAGGRNSPQA